MSQYAPGFYIREVETPSQVEGVSVELSGMVGVTERGPVDRPILTFSEDDWRRRFGGYLNGAPAPMCVKDYYEQGARPLYFVRVVGAGAAESLGEINPFGGTLKTIDLKAASPGEWGDNIIINTLKVSSVLTAATAAGNYTVVVSSVAGFQLGDVVKVGAAGPFFIVGITTTTKTLRLHAPVGAIVPVGSAVYTATRHKSRTALQDAIPDPGDASQMHVSDISNIGVGDVLIVYTGTSPTSQILLELLVTKVNGTYITYRPLNSVIAGLTSVPAGAWVTSTDFSIDLFNSSEFIETYEYLSMRSEDKQDYVDVRLGPSGADGSIWIEVTDSVNTELMNFESFRYPMPVSNYSLSGGLDGSAPSDDDYLGLNATKTYRHGIKLFDGIVGLAQVGIPGVTTAGVLKGAAAWAYARRTTLFVGDIPPTIDTTEEAVNFREVDLNLDNDEICIYLPWHYDRHPKVPGAELLVPPSGRMLGIMSEVSARRGVNKAPANEPYTTAIKLAWDVPQGDLGLLNEAGINVIRTFPGRGIRPFGARTLAMNKDGKHFIPIRRVLNYAKESIAQIGNRFTFEPITEDLWRQLETAILRYFRQLWLEGVLYPRNDFSRAAFVRIDAGLNPPDVVISGRVNGKAGIQPTPPAEVILFDFSLFSGGAEFTELT
jgi:hypothetical protein